MTSGPPAIWRSDSEAPSRPQPFQLCLRQAPSETVTPPQRWRQKKGFCRRQSRTAYLNFLRAKKMDTKDKSLTKSKNSNSELLCVFPARGPINPSCHLKNQTCHNLPSLTSDRSSFRLLLIPCPDTFWNTLSTFNHTLKTCLKTSGSIKKWCDSLCVLRR